MLCNEANEAFSQNGNKNVEADQPAPSGLSTLFAQPLVSEYLG